MSQILTLTDISYCYPGAPEPLFEHLSATFAAGWAAVLGDNGIGKTTLAKLACGMLSPDSGTVSPNPCKMAVAYCPQRTDETPTNLDDFAADWTGETIAIRDALNIGDDWAYRYETLSGGEAKRLQIACALAGDPDVLVLDEPTNHVDGRTRQAITQAMRRFDGIGIVISHDVELIDATCSRCVMLERRHARGRNITAANTYPRPRSRCATINVPIRPPYSPLERSCNACSASSGSGRSVRANWICGRIRECASISRTSTLAKP